MAEIVKLYYCNNSIRQVRDFWAGMHPDRQIPSKSYLSKLIRRFEETGSFNKNGHGGSRRTGFGENTEINVLSLISETPEMCTSEIARIAGISKTSVLRILHKHKFHSFKIQRHQELLPADVETRSIFCNEVFELANNDASFLKNVCFTDESSFTLHGEPNSQNKRIWAKENPHYFLQTRTQSPQKVNVWLGILGHHIIGPFYIDGNLNGEKYLELLQHRIYPEIHRIMGNRIGDVWFQHDGCPSHYTRDVIHFLNTHFPNKWIGRGGIIRWPPRSPDLSPNDFHFWGHIKNKIYGHHVLNNLEELKAAIGNVCGSLSRKHLANVRREFYDRLSHCLIQNGGHFEHLLK